MVVWKWISFWMLAIVSLVLAKILDNEEDSTQWLSGIILLMFLIIPALYICMN